MKKKFAVVIGFTATVEGESHADALANLGISLNYFHFVKDARNVSMRVLREITPINQTGALAEAPFADQVTIHESDGEVEPVPFAPTPLADAAAAPIPVTAGDDIQF